MNKKAAVSTLMADVMAIVVFAIVAAGFFTAFKIGFGGHAEYSVLSRNILIAPQISAQAYLRAPVQFKGAEISIAELASWSFNNKNYTALDKETDKIFKDFDYYRIYVCDEVAWNTFTGPGRYIEPDTCPYSMVKNPRWGASGVTKVFQAIENIDPDEHRLMIVFEAE